MTRRHAMEPTTGPSTSVERETARENLLDLTPAAAAERLGAFALEHGQPAYRGGQAARRLWTNPAGDFQQMTELPAAFRALLAEHFVMPRLALVARQKSSDGTEKFLFRLHDGEAIETVAIPDGDRMTFCI